MRGDFVMADRIAEDAVKPARRCCCSSGFQRIALRVKDQVRRDFDDVGIAPDIGGKGAVARPYLHDAAPRHPVSCAPELRLISIFCSAVALDADRRHEMPIKLAARRLRVVERTGCARPSIATSLRRSGRSGFIRRRAMPMFFLRGAVVFLDASRFRLPA